MKFSRWLGVGRWRGARLYSLYVIAPARGAPLENAIGPCDGSGATVGEQVGMRKRERNRDRTLLRTLFQNLFQITRNPIR